MADAADRLAGPQAGARYAHLRIAVIVPCYNEAVAIAKVVEDFSTALPAAIICEIGRAHV